jgi:hypothetical protein
MPFTAPELLTDTPVTSPCGAYSLSRIDDEFYVLTGPDAHYSRDWLTAALPAGQWWTTWRGVGDEFVVDITR